MTYYVNGDDLGYSHIVNCAMFKCLREGIIHSASLMANMPGTDEAIDVIVRDNLIDKIGIHFNLTEGRAISKEMAAFGRFCNSKGNFITTKSKRIIRLNDSEKKVIYTELNEQLNVLKNKGLMPVFIDSHSHIHEEPAILPIIIRIARENNIKKIRIAKNLNNSNLVVKVYRQAINYILRLMKLNRSNYFGSINDFNDFVAKNKDYNGLFEIMIHPTFDINNNLIDSYTNEMISEL